MQRTLTSLRDTPKFCQSSPACPVNLRCISTVLRLRAGGEEEAAARARLSGLKVCGEISRKMANDGESAKFCETNGRLRRQVVTARTTHWAGFSGSRYQGSTGY
jgi:hypothetical protein